MGLAERRTGRTFAVADGRSVWLRNAPRPGMYFVTADGVFDLSQLASMYSEEWLKSLTSVLQKCYAFRPKSTTEKSILALKRALMFAVKISAENEKIQILLNLTKRNESLLGAETELAELLRQIERRLCDTNDTTIIKSPSRRTRGAFVEQFQDVCDALVRINFFPPIRMIQRPSYSPVHFDQKTVSIGEMICGADYRQETVSLYNRSAIAVIRREMSSFLLQRYILFKGFQNKIREDNITISQIISDAENFDRRFRENCPDASRENYSFPLGDQDRFLLSALRLRQHIGLGRGAKNCPMRYQRLFQIAGGSDYLLSLIEGNSECMAAAYTIVMIDSGANVQPIDDIAADPQIRKSTIGGHSVLLISSTKNRAKYKEVQIVVEDEARLSIKHQGAVGDISALDAIRMWAEMSASIRSDIVSSDRAYLWVLRTTFSCSRYSPQTWSSVWERMRRLWASDKFIGGVKFSRANVRKSLIHVVSAANGFDVERSAQTFQHSSKVALRNYILRPYTNKTFDDNIREFQVKLSQIFFDYPFSSANSDAGCGASKRDWGVSTGIGVTCFQPDNQVADDGFHCTSVEKCSSCPMMRFVPGPSSIADLIWFQQSLWAAQPSFLRDNSERWQVVWLPALALCEAIIRALKQGPMRGLVEQTGQKVAASIASGERVRFVPW